MRIGVIGPIWLRIPPIDYGGSEIVVYNLVEGLVDRGHEVTLFAAGGSQTRATLRSVLDRPLYDIKGKFDFSDPSYDLLNATLAFQASSEFDVLHNMVGYQLLCFAPFTKCPLLHTSHSSKREYEGLTAHFADDNFVSISNAQRTFHPKLNYVRTIYHGIDTSVYIPTSEIDDYLLFISRIMPEKGVELAIQAARESGHRLIIAGNVDERDKEYFENTIKPELNEDIQYIGSANEKQKVLLYQKAKALLFPTQWHEAFGLVMIEAMACGTPVIGWNRGAVPEVITPHKTGFVVESLPEMVAAIQNVGTISRDVCRQEAEQRFSRPAMAEQYESVYQELQQ